mmetsp:Transcript_38498/g.93155  ORF Transcript_38498/g.93155 Transcript_38498/m.93155 type:complete len:123 (-) Transcript_38498:556-924(-)
MGVSRGSPNFKHSIVNGKESHIKSTTTQVKDKNILFPILFVKSISNGSGSRFIDHTLYLEPSNGSSILGGLTLGISKVGWNSDYGMFDFFAKVSFGSFLHFPKNHSTDFLWSELTLAMFGGQ